MSVTDSTSQLPAPIHTLSWPGQALPSFPFPGFIVPWYRSDTLWQHQRNSSSKASQDANPWFPCFEKASFQFSHEFLLLGDTVSHCALADHPDVHDNTAVLSQSRCALLRGEQVIPDGDGEHHTSRTFQQQIAKEVQEKEKAINNFLCQFIWSELIINGNAGKSFPSKPFLMKNEVIESAHKKEGRCIWSLWSFYLSRKMQKIITALACFPSLYSTKKVSDVFLNIPNVNIFNQHSMKTIFTRDLIL